MVNTSNRVASAVSAAIESAGHTQVSIADATGIPRTTLIRRLRGQQPFTIAELDAIANTLGVHVTTFLATEDAA